MKVRNCSRIWGIALSGAVVASPAWSQEPKPPADADKEDSIYGDSPPTDDEASKPEVEPDVEPAPPKPPPASSGAAARDGLTLEEAERLAAKATDLNRQGVRLLDAGDVERALEHFLMSRDVLPTTKNVANAAICLERLGRFDEALELLEELLKFFAGGLDDADRAAIGPMMEGLRGRVASLEVSSNAGGTLLVDGRERAKLPLRTAVRILGGHRKVQVVKNGFETFEVAIDAKAGERVTVQAELRPVRGVGQLVVEDDGAVGTQVFVDGANVGVAPWEGSLAPGHHFVWLQDDEIGTAPAKVVIVEGQTALVSLESRPLGAPVRVVSHPAAAEIELEGTALGTGTWVGRLPLGSYRFRISEPGYHEQTVSFESAGGRDEQALTIRLPLDPDHPRWPKTVRGDFWVDAFGGFSGGSSLGGTAAEDCPRLCEGSATVLGALVGLRGGYRFPFGLSAELAAGYWRLGSSFDRTLVDQEQSSSLTLQVRDQILVHGPFAAAGVSYRGFLDGDERLHLIGRASIGALLANATDPVAGVASANGAPSDLRVEDRNQVLTSVAPFLMPEVGVGYRFGALSVALGLGVGLFPAQGPEFERGRVSADPASTTPGNPSPRETSLLEGERAYSSFLLWVPQASVGLTL